VTRNGRRRYLVGAIGCMTVLVSGLIWLFLPTPVRMNSYALATVDLPDVRDASRSLHFGGPRDRPLVINFFFSDCVGCVTELPRIEAAAKSWAGRIDVVGIDHFEPLASGLAFVRSTKVTFPVAYDESGVFAPQVGANAFPATLFVDTGGIVRQRVLGQISASRLNRELESLSTTSHVK
jgi:thiol-disulfide isomerase/thioredoxin